jgi:hypothetical protein
VRAPAVWKTLGIERTEDLAAIRRAYAKRLKAIDVEAEPQAFIALREARDHALSMALLPMPEEGLPEAGEPGDRSFEVLFADDPGGTVFVPDLAAGTEPADPDEAERRALFIEIDNLLFGEEEPDPERLQDSAQRLLDRPEMENIGLAAEIEAWIAGEAAASIPRSDPILPLLVERFGWEDREEAWDAPWDVDLLVQRHRGRRLIDAASTPGNGWHRAWLQLVGDEPTLPWDRYFRRGEVRRFLTLVREHYPGAEAELNPHRVALWDAHYSGGIQRGMRIAMILFWTIFILLRFGLLAWIGFGT